MMILGQPATVCPLCRYAYVTAHKAAHDQRMARLGLHPSEPSPLVQAIVAAYDPCDDPADDTSSLLSAAILAPTPAPDYCADLACMRPLDGSPTVTHDGLTFCEACGLKLLLARQPVYCYGCHAATERTASIVYRYCLPCAQARGMRF